VILAGNGIRLSKSQDLFIEIAKSLNIPVLSTWKAMDIFDENDSIFFGRPGTVAQRGANFIQQNSDCIISLGCRLDFGQIGYAQETFAREAKKIIVDIDGNEFKKFRFPIDVKIEANVLNFLTVFSDKIKYFEFPEWEEWRSTCLNWKSKYSIMKQDFGDSEYTSTYALVDEISTQLNSKDVVVPCSSGSGADITSQTFRVKKGQRVLNSPGLGSMGYGVPQSIGACVAFEKNRTICINGDGGFQLNIQELETIYRLKLPIKFFYLNNQGYLSIKNTQINYFQSRLVVTDSSSGLTLPDIQKIAKAYNIKSNKIVNNSGLQVGVREAIESDGPFICEVMINPEEQVTPKVKTVLGNNGKLISKPLEDLFPFLERSEFLENMIVKPLDE
jgi:acetolactate synthase-1/2/3 large subunit